MKQIVKVNGMKCDGCASNVSERFGKLSGVSAVDVNLADKQATLETRQEISTADLQAALADTKYQVVSE